MSRPASTLLFLAFLAFFFGLGRMAITDADEAFYARAAWEMVESGDWLTPRFNFEDRWQKPALYYWLTAGLYQITGPSEWAARFWSALAGLGLAFLTWRMAAHLTRRPDAALLAGTIVATCFGCFMIGRMALPDLPLAFCITLTIWAALRAGDAGAVNASPEEPRVAATGPARRLVQPGVRSGAAIAVTAAGESRGGSGTPVESRRWWAICGVAGGLGFLMKGPVAIVLPAIVLLPLWGRERLLTRLHLRGIALAALLAAAIALPWYVAMGVEHGAAYLESFFVGDNLERFATTRYNEPRGLFYYVPVVIGGLLPWSVFLLVLPWRAIRQWVGGHRHIALIEWRLLLWAAMPLIFYTASFGKQPRYILPVLPPLAILLGLALARRLDEAHRGGDVRALRAATIGTGALFLIAALVLARAHPLFLDAYTWATWIGVGALLGLGMALTALAVSAQWSRLPGALAMSAGLLLVVVQFGALAGIRPAPVEQMAALVETHRHAAEPVGAYHVFVRNLVFYSGVRQTALFDDEAVIEFLESPARVLLVIAEADLARLESRAALSIRRLASVRYIDTAAIRIGTLLRPDAATHVERVLLVENRGPS